MDSDHEETRTLWRRAAATFQPLAGEPTPFDETQDWGSGHAYGEQVPLSGFPDESSLMVGVLGRLEPWFHVRREVPGKHPTGAPCRIDAILTPKDAHCWKNPAISLGVEFKAWYSYVAHADRRDTTGWVAQAIDYAHVDWQGFDRIPVFMCPDPFKRHRSFGASLPPVATFVDGLLGKYNVGYLALFRGVGLAMLMQGQHMIWSERYGVSTGRRWSLRPKVGHRS
ncbi:hypothetical protein [Streptomyces sp. FIT100]|uniref:hypothetical protein n=1 Tax=Streptomyces sp. FIT100 TaxID=2837956 RepID=UPI0021C6DF2C|nr:hypothetical protein [Streptomyces sp. FIT100]UUN28587.1 hypothetical protein KK483_21035 [Streptomyces sp. FIT100]